MACTALIRGPPTGREILLKLLAYGGPQEPQPGVLHPPHPCLEVNQGDRHPLVLPVKLQKDMEAKRKKKASRTVCDRVFGRSSPGYQEPFDYCRACAPSLGNEQAGFSEACQRRCRWRDRSCGETFYDLGSF